jgi:hypothetical protein
MKFTIVYEQAHHLPSMYYIIYTRLNIQALIIVFLL